MDILIILILLIIVFGSYIYIRITYNKYKKEDIKSLKSGFEVSRKIIDKYDLNNIYITESREALFSYYDSNRKVIRLTKDVFNDTSLVSCAISSMNATYAIEEKEGNKILKFRNTFKDLINIILYFGYLFLAVGALFGNIKIMLVGIALEYIILLYYMFTYNLEKKTKNRALIELINNKIITKKEQKKIETILKATSFIYMASIVFPVVKLFKLIVDFGNSKED
jgi:hypothetical protein